MHSSVGMRKRLHNRLVNIEEIMDFVVESIRSLKKSEVRVT